MDVNTINVILWMDYKKLRKPLSGFLALKL